MDAPSFLVSLSSLSSFFLLPSPIFPFIDRGPGFGIQQLLERNVKKILEKLLSKYDYQFQELAAHHTSVLHRIASMAFSDALEGSRQREMGGDTTTSEESIYKFMSEALDNLFQSKLQDVGPQIQIETLGDIRNDILSLQKNLNLLVHSGGIPKADFALSSAGARILHSHRPSDSFLPNLFHSIGLKFLDSNPPELMLKDDLNPGSCWGFAGNRGVAVIELSKPIFIESLSIDHPPKELAHTLNSAPRHFSVSV